jgi:hypothetical protein
MIIDQIDNSDFNDKLPLIKKIFFDIHKACGERFWQGCGSYLFDGSNYEYDTRTFPKQVLLYEAAKNSNSVLEVGSYMGHSLLIMLASNPKIKITSIDIQDTWIVPAISVLKKYFPESDITFLHGNSLSILPTIKDSFDLFHIDGNHTYKFVSKEFSYVKNLSTSNKLKIVFDDYDVITEIDNDINNQFEILEKQRPDCIWAAAYYELELKI